MAKTSDIEAPRVYHWSSGCVDGPRSLLRQGQHRVLVAALLATTWRCPVISASLRCCLVIHEVHEVHQNFAMLHTLITWSSDCKDPSALFSSRTPHDDKRCESTESQHPQLAGTSWPQIDATKNLSLCLEPEAACLSVEASKMEPWDTGTKLMVLDCGGGTIDITTHHVKSSSPLALEELHEPTGGPWGSTIVDAKFKDFIKNLLDCENDEWDHLDASSEMLGLYRQWEEKKTGYHPGKPIRLKMGEILDVMNMDVPTFEATVNKETHPQQKKSGVRALKKTLTIKHEKVASLFEDVIDDITRKTKEVIEREDGISVVYMVGGFSSNPLLQEKVAARVSQLHRNIKVVFPPHPSLAIVLGAALHGANGSSIVCRKARLTYGIHASTKYNPRNPEHKRRSSKVNAIGNKMYLETFRCFVERGEDLPVGTKREHTFYPLEEDEKEITFRIHVSRRPAADVKFLKDPGVSNAVSTIFTVTAPVDTGVSFSDRGLSLGLYFGGTEIHVLIKRCSDGLEVPATTIFVENMDEETDEAIAQPLFR